MEPVSTASAERYGWGDGCDGWHLVRGADLSVIQERMPSGAMEARHRHSAARQFFYVLSGALTMEVEGRVHVMPAGTGVEVEPGVAHQARNDSAADVHFLVVSTPPSHGDRQPAPRAGQRQAM